MINIVVLLCNAESSNDQAAPSPALTNRPSVASVSETAPPAWIPKPPVVAPPDLGRSINEVVKRREFAWRFPRDKIAGHSADEQGFFARFVEEAIKTIRDALKPIKRWLEKFGEWLRDFLRRWQIKPPPRGTGDIDWQRSVLILGIVLLAIVACGLGIFLWRNWRKRRQAQVAQAVIAVPVPDIRNEAVQADQLAPDEWQMMANEMLCKGEFRLALRAFFLSTLAFLAQREWVVVARCKTNREYEKELGRRAASCGEMVEAFHQNVGMFEKAWYGTHEATRGSVESFAMNHQKIKTSGEK